MELLNPSMLGRNYSPVPRDDENNQRDIGSDETNCPSIFYPTLEVMATW